MHFIRPLFLARKPSVQCMSLQPSFQTDQAQNVVNAECVTILSSAARYYNPAALLSEFVPFLDRLH